jgi:hypothetical protein
VTTIHEEAEGMYLIAADTAFQLAHDRRQRLLLEHDVHPRRRPPRRRLRRRPSVSNLPGRPPLDAA